MLFFPKNIITGAANTPKALAQEAKLHASQMYFMDDLLDLGWRFFIVKQNCGYCIPSKRVITIPTFAIARERKNANGYLNWYVSHEMAHAFAPREENHGPAFMEELKRICPTEYQYHEMCYKPKNAMTAGVCLDGVMAEL